jgi:hypothetical protein
MVAIVEKTAEFKGAVANQQAAMFLHRRPLRSRYAGNQEPNLVDLLTDPMLHRLLASDGVKSDHLIELIADVRVRLSRRDRVA